MPLLNLTSAPDPENAFPPTYDIGFLFSMPLKSILSLASQSGNESVPDDVDLKRNVSSQAPPYSVSSPALPHKVPPLSFPSKKLLLSLPYPVYLGNVETECEKLSAGTI